MATTTTTDRAVDAALDILDGTICECGHLVTEHVGGAPPNACAEPDCACPQFQPVNFHVQRADVVD